MVKTFGSRSLADRWGRSPTQVALGNAAGRLPGGKPDEGEPHVRFGKGEQETGRWDRACSLLHRHTSGSNGTRSLPRWTASPSTPSKQICRPPSTASATAL